jgi:hypothetical protein
MRMGKTQISKIRNVKEKTTTNTKEIQGIIKDYFNNLYSNKLEYFEEMGKSLDTYAHPKLSQEDINHLIIFKMCETDSGIKSLPKQKCPGHN